MGAGPEEAYDGVPTPAADRHAGAAAPAVGRANMKWEVLDSKLGGKGSGFLEDGRVVNLVNGAPAALLEVLTVEALGRVLRSRLYLQTESCRSQPLAVQ